MEYTRISYKVDGRKGVITLKRPDKRNAMDDVMVSELTRAFDIGSAVLGTLAALLTACAVSTRVGTDLLETLSAMFNPLPAIALLPLALLWFGLGNPSLMFVMIHSVL